MRTTNAERILIDRRRRNETQVDAAERYGIPLSVYLAIERKKRLCFITVDPMKLKPREVCLLTRRRFRLSQAEVAKDLGCCRRWVVMMERGEAPCKELEEYWSE